MDKLLLLEVLKSSLWGTPLSSDELTEETYVSLMEIAKEQAVAGFVLGYFADRKLKLSRNIVRKTVGILMSIKNSNIKINHEIHLFTNFLESHKIPYIIVKGQVAAQWYENPLMRQSGDVDIYVDEENFDRAEKVIKEEFHVPMQMDEYEKHSEFQIRGVLYELHRDLVQFASCRHQRAWEILLQVDESVEVSVDSVGVRTLSPTLNALYIFIHLFSHLLQSGVGLRQVCDLAMCLHHYRDQIDRRKLERYLLDLDLMNPFLAVGAVMTGNLGLPIEDFPFVLQMRDSRRGKRILKDMLWMGNFGKRMNITEERGFLHKVQTCAKILFLSCRYIGLAPQEVLLRFPRILLVKYRNMFKRN